MGYDMSIISTVYGVGAQRGDPYRTKIQLPFGWRFHKFYRPDEDRAWHDHPNHFWTFPFADYLEELFDPATGRVTMNIVKGWRWHYRPATYTHRLMGRLGQPSRSHWTLVHEILPEFRMWGFYVEQPDGRFAYIPWRDYIFGGVRS
jgi:hypothetical protein